MGALADMQLRQIPLRSTVVNFMVHTSRADSLQVLNKLWCESTTNPVPVLRIAAPRGFLELTKNVIRSSRGHSTPSLKISCKSVWRFARNVHDKEISIAASRGFSDLTQN